MARDALHTLGLDGISCRHRERIARGSCLPISMNTPCIPSQDSSHKSRNARPTRNEPGRSVTGVGIRSGPIRACHPSIHCRPWTPDAPRSRTPVRTAARAGVAMAIQMAMRASNGSATATSTTPQTTSSQLPARVAARSEGWISIRPQDGGTSVWAPDGATECRVPGIFGDIARDQIANQVGIGQFEKFDEGGTFIACGTSVSIT